MSEPSEEPQIPQISTGLGFQAGSPIAYGRITGDVRGAGCARAVANR